MSDIEFNFEKFVADIEKRNDSLAEEKRNPNHVIDIDEKRRLREKMYQEKWQNSTKWER